MEKMRVMSSSKRGCRQFDYAAIAEYAKTGRYSLSHIGRKFNCSVDTVRKALREHDVEMEPFCVMSDNDLADMQRDRDNHMTLEEVSKKYGVSVRFVCNKTSKPDRKGVSLTDLSNMIADGNAPTERTLITHNRRPAFYFEPISQ